MDQSPSRQSVLNLADIGGIGMPAAVDMDLKGRQKQKQGHDGSDRRPQYPPLWIERLTHSANQTGILSRITICHWGITPL
jgi:hypothetical protein